MLGFRIFLNISMRRVSGKISTSLTTSTSLLAPWHFYIYLLILISNFDEDIMLNTIIIWLIFIGIFDNHYFYIRQKKSSNIGQNMENFNTKMSTKMDKNKH